LNVGRISLNGEVVREWTSFTSWVLRGWPDGCGPAAPRMPPCRPWQPAC